MKKLVLLATVLLVSATFTYAQFQFTSIDYPGGFGTRVRGINNHGQMVGEYTDQYGNYHALLIKDGKFIPLAPGTILGNEFSDAFKINDRGDVVGWVCDLVACHGFLLRKGVLTILDFPGASDTYASGINESGTIVGAWDLYDSSGNFLYEQGFTWKDGNFTEVTFPGSGDTYPFGINARGDFVGGWDAGPTSTTGHGFVFSQGQFLSFDAPIPDFCITQADGISATGKIVGQYYSISDCAGGGLTGHGFLKVGDTFTSINYPGAVLTTGWGINSRGQMVGAWYDSSLTAHGWLAQGDQGKPLSLKGPGLGRSKTTPSVRHTTSLGRQAAVPTRAQRMSQ